ncbi:SGNH/GDSL hydrolase family protein [Nostocoides sp. HKS02]|uniref:SGNH/GDSL hydrolase family protein n=1 Tax=Nostocoides sp. HKS02 TaxID=1813880 RepID=UPI0012B471A7|nr:SGNH/GDSL hydrolase family protein [Tetrasphaera sp. HKS02]QGN57756.1 hypothetical protein GKE56_07565 [Tetrasphaera sp. HKS02]
MPAPRTRLAVGALALLLAALTGCSSAAMTTAPMAGQATVAAPATATPATPTPATPTKTPITATTSTTADTSPVVVVGLGDSVTSGFACDCTTFIALYAALLRQRAHRPTEAVNLGVAGLTSMSLSEQLDSVAARVQLSRAGVVVLTIGANDLNPLIGRWQKGGCDTSCIEPATDLMGTRLAAVLTRLGTLVPAGAHILVTTYWNVFEDGDVADADYGKSFGPWSAAVTRSANAHICTAAAQAGDSCVDLYEPFEGAGDRNPTALLADDGDHPNAAGHRLIAQTLIQADSLGALG